LGWPAFAGVIVIFDFRTDDREAIAVIIFFALALSGRAVRTRGFVFCSAR